MSDIIVRDAPFDFSECHCAMGDGRLQAIG